MHEGRSAAEQLDEIVAAVAANPSIEAKRSIGMVSDAIGPSGFLDGPGDARKEADVVAEAGPAFGKGGEEGEVLAHKALGARSYNEVLAVCDVGGG